jgi:hypothetical protein
MSSVGWSVDLAYIYLTTYLSICVLCMCVDVYIYIYVHPAIALKADVHILFKFRI